MWFRIWNSKWFQWFVSATIALILIFATSNPSLKNDISHIKKTESDMFVFMKKLARNDSIHFLNDSILRVKTNHFPSNPLSIKDMTSISSHYGYRVNPIDSTKEFHAATDFRAPRGTPVYAAAEGIVTKAGWDDGFGNIIEVDTGYGYVYKNSHLHTIKVNKGQKVLQGEFIGTVGSTGNTTGSHLDFRVSYYDTKTKKNYNINPEIFTLQRQ
jgi:murein DD-endopeptidase MepM/ murein hydrolase activator NlpD